MDAFRASSTAISCQNPPLGFRNGNRQPPRRPVESKPPLVASGVLQKQLVVPGAQTLASANSSPQRIAATVSDPSGSRAPDSSDKQPVEGELPAFLRRRSQKETTATTPASAQPPVTSEESLRVAYAAEQRRRGVDEDAIEELDEQLLHDSDEEDEEGVETPLTVDDDETEMTLLSEKELMAMADDMTATTGLTQVEVIALLREFEEKKKAAIAQKKNPRAFFTEAKPPRKAKQRSSDANPGPPLVLPKLSADVEASRFPIEQPPSGAPVPVPPQKDEVESEHDRTQRLLMELLDPRHDDDDDDTRGDSLLDGEMTSFHALRKQRAFDRHQAVTNYLAAKRQGTVRPPLESAADEKFVQAYQAQIARRLEKTKEKNEQKRKAMEEEQQARREKGFLSNLAIRKQIEQTAEAKKKQQDDMAARVARLREMESIWDV